MTAWRRLVAAVTSCGCHTTLSSTHPITTHNCYTNIGVTTLHTPLRHITRHTRHWLSKQSDSISPEAQLDRVINALVAQRQASGAVQVMQHALVTGRVEPSVADLSYKSGDKALNCYSSDVKVRPVFSWKALAATLYACEACHAERLALQLVQDVRRCGVVQDAMWREERVLAVLLRLHCAVQDGPAAQHLFTFMCQHNLLRRRSASVFLGFCCDCKQRAMAFAVYEECQRRHIELTVEDYVRLGRLCVIVHEPIATLHVLLQSMQDYIAAVPEEMVQQVFMPWCAQQQEEKQANTSSHVAQCDLVEIASSTSTSTEVPCAINKVQDDISTETRVGTCPRCACRLEGYPFTETHRTQLLNDLQRIIDDTCRRRPRARQGFIHWQRYLSSRLAAQDTMDILLDGANIGYYGLAKWYAEAKRDILLCQGKTVITPESIDFAVQCKHAQGTARRAVDVNVNFTLIDLALRAVKSQLGKRRPLVILHERHCDSNTNSLSQSETALLAQWRAEGCLYCTPHGLNDDLCWLYAALILSPTNTHHNSHTTNVVNNNESEGGENDCPVWVVTNDLMRDHHFSLLSPRCFTRWRDRCRVSFRCARSNNNETRLLLQPPAPFTRCIQQVSHSGGEHHAWHIPYYAAKCEDNDTQESGKGGVSEESEDTSMQKWLCMRI